MKRKKTRTSVSHKNITPELPQNIIPVGERVFDDKNIYIHQKVYAQIHKFSANKTENEHGGLLVGRVVNEMGKENTIIEGFIEAKYNTATPTTLTFTHDTWEYFHSEIDKKYKGKKIVGWIHTHPNFGIFLSENDKFIQQNFFADSNQVAYVVDPIQHDEGFFFWINDKLERCPGFYLFDENGVKIKQKPWIIEGDENDLEIVGKRSKLGSLLGVFLVIILITNLFVTLYQAKRISFLEKQVSSIEKQVEDQKIVIQYGMFGIAGAPEISVLADNIRKQIQAQQKAEQQAVQETMKQQKEKQITEQSEQEQNEEKAVEVSEQAEINTENNGGIE